MKSITIKCLIIALLLIIAQNVLSQTGPPSISYSGSQTFTVGTPITPLTPTNSGGTVGVNGQTTTLAGSTTTGFANGTGTAATFNHPEGLAVDALGNVYVSDAYNSVIRKITPAGLVTTYAGTGSPGAVNGPASSATFHTPQGLAVDGAGNVYVADSFNNLIRKITAAGVVSTLAGNGTAGFVDGGPTAAEFNSPASCAVDALGNVYVTDNLNNRIRIITPAGVVSTLAGSGSIGSADGTGTAATFHYPYGITIGPSGNLYVSDWYNHEIRKITPAGVVTTLAGTTTAGYADNSGSAARFNYPVTIISDASENLYVADEHNYMVRKVTSAGAVSTIAGTTTSGSTNGAGASASFNYPFAIGIDSTGYVYVGEYGNSMIRKVAVSKFSITPGFTNGLKFNTTTGTISGTPNAVSASTPYQITAYNSSGISTATLNVTVNAAPAPVPSASQNYVITYTPRVAANLTTAAAVVTASSDKTKVETAIQYIDGIGRPLQSVQVHGSPQGNDLIQPFAYDAYGRQATKYLPYAPQTGTTGSYRSTAVTDQAAFYTTPPTGSGVSAITDPFAQANFEVSPFNRIVEQGAPGAAWQLSTSGIMRVGNTVKMVYTLNNSIAFSIDSVNGRQVARYNATINGDQSRTIAANGYYAANTLSVTISKDENWVSGRAGTIEEYKDKEGHVVLKRVYNYTTVLQVLSTYYVYDDFGKLAFVLPPMANGDAATTPSITTLNNLCYQYRYDERGRQSQKKIPGTGWEYTIYNTIDQPVATQDSTQRVNNNWLFDKYDGLGRVVLFGIWNNNNTAITRASLQNTLTGINTNLWEAPVNTGNGYTNVGWPTSGTIATLTTTYYDSYTNIPGLPTAYTLTTGVSNMTRGVTTAKKTAVLNTPTDQLWDVSYSDDLGRSIKSYTQHYLNGIVNTNNYDFISTTYSFTNAPATVTRQHYNTTTWPTPLVTIANKYTYDHMGRKLKTWEQITNGNTPTTPTWISKIDYNEIGQVLNKHLHSTDSINFYQNVAYTYNERGWLLTSNAPLFTMSLYYNTAGSKAYNGNIMQQNWVTPTTPLLYYTYTYDKLNRLLAGTSSAGNHENNISYDLNGNIDTLNRYQTGTLIDHLAYNYIKASNPTNQLQSINDNSGNDAGLKHGTWSYAYDGNGNLTSDPSKGTSGINISYNILNLPQNITGSLTITYVYDAAGNKLRKVSTSANLNTDYIGGIQYDGTTTPSLSFIQTEEGRAIWNGSSAYNYEYSLGDNLGNTRITFDTGNGYARTVQQDDYYPFGMAIETGTIVYPKNEYLYNKKELQEETGLYDYGGRYLDPVLGRWTTIDPLAEVSRNKSPYHYVDNNPIRFIDPDGMSAQTVGDSLKNKVEVAKLFEKLEQGPRQSDSKGTEEGLKAFILSPTMTATQVAEAPAVGEVFETLASKNPLMMILSTLFLSGDNMSQPERMKLISQEIVKDIITHDIAGAVQAIFAWNSDERNKTNKIVFRYLSVDEYKGIVKSADGHWVLPPVDRSSSWSEKYITPDLYLSSKIAYDKLALPNAPQLGVFTFESLILPSKTPPGEGVYLRVLPGSRGQSGNGREATIWLPFPVMGGFPLKP